MAESKKARAAGTRRQFVLLGVAIALMAITLGGFVYLQELTTRHATWLDVSRQMSIDVQTLAQVGRNATQGVQPDFGVLDAQAVTFDDALVAMRDGDPNFGIKEGVARLPYDLQDELEGVANSWTQMRASINQLLENEEQYHEIAANIVLIDESLGQLLTDSNLSNAQIIAHERARLTARQLLTAGRDASRIARELRALVRQLADLGEYQESVTAAVNDIVEDSASLTSLQEAASTLQGEALNVIAAAKVLEQAVLDYTNRFRVLPTIVIGIGVVAVGLLGAFVVLFLALTRRQLREAQDKDSRQQQAILELLDEITNLADGDLTVDVTVTEDFTGAIADSINFTVASMRNLVGTITDTSVEIANAASSTAETARKMNAASERQAKEVANVTTVIVQSSQQLQQVATRAEELAQEAQRSVEIAHNGAETVGRTIQGMATLREQIQDTSKRIKRLGESSQEIGNIIEFINDIAEQTNTLALNASIQAAMAGEAGRGFAVVADEVQRLAERAANATKQIENLVKTIQADTSEAIVSMERSTSNVVSGAKAAEEAGQALNHIETSSLELARLITEISSSARTQSAQANKIAGTMQVIRDIAVQTSGSAAQTAEAVGELTSLSEKLRDSVAGFKLPESQAA